jgi:hypothetical protein
VISLENVLSEASVPGNTTSLEVLTKQRRATSAIEAFITSDSDVSYTSISSLEIFNVLSEFDYSADTFVSGDERKFGDEFSFVNVLICPTDTAARNFQKDIVVADLRDGYLLDFKISWLVVPESSHCSGRHYGL